MKVHLMIILLIALMTVSGSAFAQTTGPGDAVETVNSGKINWTVGEVYASGIGAPPAQPSNAAQARAMAERAAFVVALRNLLEVVKGVRVDSETMVENYMIKSDVIRTRVEGIVKGARIVKKQYMSDGSVEMLVAMPMKGMLMDTIVPETFGRPAGGQMPSKPAPIPQKPSDVKPSPQPLKPAEPSLPPVPPPVGSREETRAGETAAPADSHYTGDETGAAETGHAITGRALDRVQRRCGNRPGDRRQGTRSQARAVAQDRRPRGAGDLCRTGSNQDQCRGTGCRRLCQGREGRVKQFPGHRQPGGHQGFASIRFCRDRYCRGPG